MNKVAAIKDAIKSIGKAFTEEGRPSHIREIASLGTLAAPSAYHLATGKDMNEKVKDVAEVGGLAALAAPYALKLRKGIK
jgi:hypothetical protein